MKMELNEALTALKKAGFIAEAKNSWEKFLPKDSDTIQELAVKALDIKRTYDKASNNEKYMLAQIYNIQRTDEKDAKTESEKCKNCSRCRRRRT